jgi:hypothetical protein
VNRAGQVEPLRLDVLTDGEVRQLRVRFRGARLTFALCGCPPLASAIEAAALIRWAWDIPPDDAFSAIVAAIR